MVIQEIKDLFGYPSKKFPKGFSKIVDNLESHQNINSDSFKKILDAYQFGESAHQGQKRKSGEPYYNHCIEVAIILSEWGMDKNIVIGGLLHDI